jgi:hypothetical protein
VKGCSPPNEVARSPLEDAALRMHVALESWGGLHCVREVRWPCAREKKCSLPARMPARRVPGRTTTGLDSFVRPLGGPSVLRQSPIEQDERGRGAHVSVRHTCASARAGAVWDAAKIDSTQPERGRGGVEAEVSM